MKRSKGREKTQFQRHNQNRRVLAGISGFGIETVPKWSRMVPTSGQKGGTMLLKLIFSRKIEKH
jgi:hypothetical protein